MRASKSKRKIAERIQHWIQELFRQIVRHRDAQTIAVSGEIFDRDKPADAGDCDRNSSPGRHQRLNAVSNLRRSHALTNALVGQIADGEQEVMQSVKVPHVVLRIESLQLTLECPHRFEIEQLTEFGIANQLAKLCLIDDQRLRAAFGEWRVA